MKCPHCNADIREAVIMSAAGRIAARRKAQQGRGLTSQQARAMQARSVAARAAARAARASASLSHIGGRCRIGGRGTPLAGLLAM
ncbi:MAG TPA: hypothetical protein VMY35_06435 [Phycisphaerae bacterium]|nr:hypothetical protein [Phycisphaerae bacterium]